MGSEAPASEYVRLVNISQFRRIDARFSSNCFQGSSDQSGISIIRMDCAVKANGSICAHARVHYPQLASEDPIFFIFDPATEFPEAKLEQLPSTGGDPCHYNLTGLSDKESKRWFKNTVASPTNSKLMVCRNGAYEPLTIAEADRAAAAYFFALQNRPS